MIRLNRIHDAGTFLVNADLVETVEACPDTTITLLTKRRFVVQEGVEEVVERIAEWRLRTTKGDTAPALTARGVLSDVTLHGHDTTSEAA